ASWVTSCAANTAGDEPESEAKPESTPTSTCSGRPPTWRASPSSGCTTQPRDGRRPKTGISTSQGAITRLGRLQQRIDAENTPSPQPRRLVFRLEPRGAHDSPSTKMTAPDGH